MFMQEIDQLLTRLSLAADLLEQQGRNDYGGLGEPLVLKHHVGTAMFTVRCTNTPNQIRAKIKTLTASAKQADKTGGISDNARECEEFCKLAKTPNRRASYSAQTAQKFLDDNEVENWQEYQRLFGKPSTLNRFASS